MQCCWIILGSALLFQPIDGQCQQDSGGNHLFGPTCEFLCHCKNREQCDTLTGACPSGCEVPWMGQACQNKDLARGKSVKHLDNVNPPKYGRNSVDGNKASCSETVSRQGNPYYPFWKLFIDEKETIRRLSITTNKPDFLEAGFNVTVENITSSLKDDRTYFPRDVELCYEHIPNSQLSSTFEINCKKLVIGNQVRISVASKTAVLALCDVNVFSDCPEHQCGKDCLTVCHCKEYNYNDKMSSTCSTGCAGRWTGEGNRCDKECDYQAWGSNCTSRCGYCKDSQPCAVETGNCLNGCAPGYHGHNCLTECQDGYYGWRCANICSDNCAGGSSKCNHVDGHCENNCTAGWQGDTCTEACQNGFYGNECKENCSSNCADGYRIMCNHVNGRCTGGCKPGWQSSTCTKECQYGTYGNRCSKRCNIHCARGCNHVNGDCLGCCKVGWRGDKCNEEELRTSPVNEDLTVCSWPRKKTTKDKIDEANLKNIELDNERLNNDIDLHELTKQKLKLEVSMLKHKLIHFQLKLKAEFGVVVADEE